MKILIADESEMISQRMANMLKQVQGVETIECSHSKKMTFEYIIIAKPDVIILDVQMFGGKGMEFVKSISRNVPLIVLFANNSFPQYKEQYVAAGADFFFDKSNEFEMLVNVVNNAAWKYVA